MGLRGGRGPRTLTFILVVSLLLTLVPYDPAFGADLAAGKCDDSRSSTHYDVYVASNACDSDDATFWICTTCWAGGEVYLSVDLGTAATVGEFRIKTTPGNAGGDGGIYIAYSDNGSSWTNAASQLPQQSAYYTDAGSGASATRTFDYTMAEGTSGAGCLPSCGVMDAHRYWRVGTGGGQATAGFRVYSFELEAGGPSEVSMEDYVYNLRITHPPFSRELWWEWRKVYTGTWQVTDSEDEILASGDMPGNEFIGSSEHVVIQCAPICGDDTYTLYVDDTGDNVYASYEIDGDADGTLIDDVLPPDILWATACYNATLDQCAAPLNGAAGKVVIQYAWTGSESAIASFCKTGTGTPPPCTGTVSSSSSQTEGTHAVTFTITVGGLWKIRVDDVTTAYDTALFTINYSTPGTVTSYVPPPSDEEDCDSSDNLCYLRGILVGILGALGTFGSEVLTGAYDTITTALLAKQPFAFIFGSIGAAGSQIVRAQAAVESSDDCSGVDFTMPTLPPVQYHAFGADRTANPQYYAYNGTVPSPTPFVFSALRCADLEPWGGTDWWQGMRAVMGPALVLGYFVQLLRRYDVKPQLGG